MSQVVFDASVALAWCFPDESSNYAEAFLMALEGKTMLVPAVWGLEVANAVLVGVRQKRLNWPEVEEFTILLGSLAMVQDARALQDYVNELLPLGRRHGLSAYDAAYLELSLRRGAALATVDKRLQKAAKAAGVGRFEG